MGVCTSQSENSDARYKSKRDKNHKNPIYVRDDDYIQIANSSSQYEQPVANDRFLTKNDLKYLQYQSYFYSDCSRIKADQLLINSSNQSGAYLIRESPNGNLVLSVLFESSNRSREILHFLLKKGPNDSICISSDKTFTTLDNLLAYYTKSNDIHCKLTKPLSNTASHKNIEDVWEESYHNVELLMKIGHGNYGDVYKGLWRNHHEVAVKTIRLTDYECIDNNKAREEFLKELEIMKKLKHKNIVKLWCCCVCSKDKPIYIVMEYLSNGNLLNYLLNDKTNKIGYKELLNMAFQIADGMSYLEFKKVVHRDLAARNMLVGEQNIVKIADFGFAQELEKPYASVNVASNTRFPLRWYAPELLEPDRMGIVCYTIKSDVWSFGMILYEIITKGKFQPYSDVPNELIKQAIKDGMIMKKPAGLCTDEYFNIMLSCWNFEPNERPSFECLFMTIKELCETGKVSPSSRFFINDRSIDLFTNAN